MKNKSIFNQAVWVGALGYFVDIYDLLLFSIVRIPSLKSLGVADAQLLDRGVFLLNVQMAGLLIGGLIWGIWGDKRGRVSVLFGSILMYSTANIVNAFVHTTEMYASLRFIAGIGLAGELGAAITLVSEVMDKDTRGWGTTIVAAVGICGAVVAALVGDFFSWRIAYVVGGVLGLVLLLLRVRLYESGLFSQMHKSEIRRGDFRMLFATRERFVKYVSCILIGIPTWYVIGILMTFSPEFGRALGVHGIVQGSKAIMFSYMGITVGDIVSGYLSQRLRSRKKALWTFLIFTGTVSLVYLNSRDAGLVWIYILCGMLGFGGGYWAIFVTNAAEQFGTNLRATVTTTTPNFVRGTVVALTLAVTGFKSLFGLINASLIVGFISFGLAFGALYFTKEPYGKDLNYYEI